MKLQNELLGALIGLARASEGNEDTITPEIEDALVEGLLVSASTDEAALTAALEKVEAAKLALTPHCCTCATPCGKNINYDMENLNNLPRDARALKLALLCAARGLAALPRTGPLEPFFYRALYAVGNDSWGAAVLVPALTEAGETLLRRQING